MPRSIAKIIHAILAAAAWAGMQAAGATAAEPTFALSSPLPYQVIQRQSPDRGTIVVAGSWLLPKGSNLPVPTAVRVRAVPAGAVEASIPWADLPFSPLAAGFRGALPAPAGAWYKLEARLVSGDLTEATVCVHPVGIGEVFVVAGQSNSANYGEVPQKPASGRVTTFDGSAWRVADDPQPGAGGEKGSFIPPLGDALAGRLRVPIGFVCVGVGSTSVREWLPSGVAFDHAPTKPNNVVALADGRFESSGRIFQVLADRLRQLGPHGARALLWHQGESDSNQGPGHTVSPADYAQWLQRVITESRRAAGWDIPWMVAQASYHSPADPGSAAFRAAQRSVADGRLTWVGPDTDALPSQLREKNGTGVHFNAEGLHRHALLWAELLGPWIEAEGRPDPKR